MSSGDELEPRTDEAEEYLEEEFEDELEDEIEEVEDGALPSPDSEQDAAADEGTSGEGEIEGLVVSRGRGIPNPMRLLSSLHPHRVARGIQAQRRNAQRLIWWLEDAGVFAAKFAAKTAIKALRPALVYLVVSRAMRTINNANDPHMRMLRQPPEKQIEYYYSSLLGKDWKQQMEQDLMDAIREVDEGYVTEEIAREKRRLSAVMLRRMEVEEWDKERMRHFYYGLYGMGPWYWDMEERLHNPFFTGARGWNGPIEGWVGENQTFRGDLDPKSIDFREAALDAIGAERGRAVTGAVRRAAAAREKLGGADEVLESRLLRGVVDPLRARAKIEAAEATAA